MHSKCRDGEAEPLDEEGEPRLSIWDTMHYTFTEPYKVLKEKLACRAESVSPGGVIEAIPLA